VRVPFARPSDVGIGFEFGVAIGIAIAIGVGVESAIGRFILNARHHNNLLAL
jgi:hypothetical protein